MVQTGPLKGEEQCAFELAAFDASGGRVHGFTPNLVLDLARWNGFALCMEGKGLDGDLCQDEDGDARGCVYLCLG